MKPEFVSGTSLAVLGIEDLGSRSLEFLCLHQSFRDICLACGANYTTKRPYASAVRHCDPQSSSANSCLPLQPTSAAEALWVLFQRSLSIRDQKLENLVLTLAIGLLALLNLAGLRVYRGLRKVGDVGTSQLQLYLTAVDLITLFLGMFLHHFVLVHETSDVGAFCHSAVPFLLRFPHVKPSCFCQMQSWFLYRNLGYACLALHMSGMVLLILLSWERYQAITDPIGFKVEQVLGDPRQKLWKSLLIGALLASPYITYEQERQGFSGDVIGKECLQSRLLSVD